MKRILIGLLGLVGVLIGGAASGQEYVPDEVLVKFTADASGHVKAALHRQNKGVVRGKVRGLDVEVVKVSPGQVEKLVRSYLADPHVEYAEPNYIATAVAAPSDPSFVSQWGLHNTGVDADIDFLEAWEYAQSIGHGGGAGNIVAIVDTGIDATHPDLAGKVVAGWNFVAGSSNTTDDNGHGTHCAGIAGAVTNNGVGISGVGFNCALMPVKVLDRRGSGSYANIASGIAYAVDHGAKVISLSLGGSFNSYTLEAAVNDAWARGALVVAAAGNEGKSRKLYPAAYTNAIAVAATDKTDRKASFSNYGTWVDVAAPGVGILSTVPGGGYQSWNGTSMATPHVAGLAGLAWADSNSSTRALIESRADAIPGTGRYWVHGRINAHRVFNLALQ
jgi:thermitase